MGRGTESLEVINARLKRAAEEADGMEAYDYLLINDDIDQCVEKMHQLIQLQHEKTSYHLDFLERCGKTYTIWMTETDVRKRPRLMPEESSACRARHPIYLKFERGM